MLIVFKYSKNSVSYQNKNIKPNISQLGEDHFYSWSVWIILLL